MKGYVDVRFGYGLEFKNYKEKEKSVDNSGRKRRLQKRVRKGLGNILAKIAPK